MNIDTSGNVGIGLTNPDYLLEVAGTISTATGDIILNEQDIYANYEYNGDDGGLRINRYGYLGGQTKFRDTNIYDGKGTILLGIDGSAKSITMADAGNFGTSTFTSAIVGGDGFKINDGGTAGTTLEIDNITVRNTLRTHIFQKDVVKATNGILYISDSAVVSATTGTTTTGTVTVRVDKSASLVAGTTYWYKDANASDGAIVSVKFTCTNSTPTATGGTPGEDDE